MNSNKKESSKAVILLLAAAAILIIFVMFSLSGIKFGKGGFAEFVIKSIEDPGSELQTRFDNTHAEYIPCEKRNFNSAPVSICIYGSEESYCAFFQTGRHVIVYDRGGLNPGIINAYIKKYNTEEIEYLITATKTGEHCRTLSDIIKKVSIAEIITDSTVPDCDAGKELISVINEKEAEVLDIHSLSEIEADDLHISLIQPVGIESVIPDIIVTTGKFCSVFSGSAAFSSEYTYSDRLPPFPDVLITDTGKNSDGITELTEDVKPMYTVISHGKEENRFFQRIKKTFRKKSKEVFPVDENSFVTIDTNGYSYTITPERCSG